MRILDYSTDQPLDDICVYLTRDEAQQLISYLQALLFQPEEHHAHLSDDEFAHELTITIYGDENIDQFDERSRRLITLGT